MKIEEIYSLEKRKVLALKYSKVHSPIKEIKGCVDVYGIIGLLFHYKTLANVCRVIGLENNYSELKERIIEFVNEHKWEYEEIVDIE